MEETNWVKRCKNECGGEAKSDMGAGCGKRPERLEPDKSSCKLLLLVFSFYRYVIVELPNNILCCAVFDGHGGKECSEYCAQNLKNVLLEYLAVHKDLEAVLHHTFLQLHSRYTQWTQDYNAGLKAGTTATVCLLRGGVELAVGHVGDSRAILFRSGVPRELTRDHCPSLIAEKDRITQSGGQVNVDNIGRHMVNETLSMSRSIGDIHLKPYGVIALPDTRTLRVKHGKDAFLLLISDGVNFVLRSEEACNVINQAEDPYRAAQLLTEQALSMSSEDNMTALVVPFGSWGKYTKSASMFFSFGIGRDMNKSSRFG
ncbi:protein phosphatase 1K, mitochondrial-like [Homarus americanus]|uniref:protein phosphatase 1K, mitochondrial-like n=1 Tax=Homarus americanus TaxID=6706 RepID=UPI001C463D37|nr:protein phosphatase 1K, mitochondrial-like [Homarus americanus]